MGFLAIGFAGAWLFGGIWQKFGSVEVAEQAAGQRGQRTHIMASRSGTTAMLPSSPVRNWQSIRRARLAGPYPAQALHIVDGDTIAVRVQVWLGHDVVTLVRLRGIDTPEINGRCAQEVERAREAKKVLAEFLASGRLSLRDIGTGKYAGRVIARVLITVPGDANAQDAGKMLLAGGYARPYQGGRRGGWCGASSQ